MWNHSSIALWIAVAIACISLFAEALTLFLIKFSGKRNAYLLLVASLTLSQAMYDVGFLFLPFYSDGETKRTYYFLSTFGGLMSSLWTNALVLFVCENVITMRVIHVNDRVF